MGPLGRYGKAVKQYQKKCVHKTGRKKGLYGGKNLLVPLPEGEKKGFFFWLGAKKKSLHRGKKT